MYPLRPVVAGALIKSHPAFFAQLYYPIIYKLHTTLVELVSIKGGELVRIPKPNSNATTRKSHRGVLLTDVLAKLNQ